MRIQRLLDYLKYSEISNLSMRDIDTNEESRAKVFNYINRALADINTEFSINQVEVIVKLTPDRCKYFINDGKLIKLLAAFYSDGTELYLNNETEEMSVFTPALNTIEWRGPNTSTDSEYDYLSLIYLKGFEDVVNSEDIVAVSEGLLEVVANYVSFLAYSTIDSSGDSPAKFYFSRYKDSVQKAKAQGFGMDENTNYRRLEEKGFV